MAFPGSPIQGEIVVVNGISYQYYSSLNAWLRYGSTSANTITVDYVNVSSNLASTNTVSGAIKVAGGIGAVGNVHVGDRLVVSNGVFWANGTSFSSAGPTGPTGATGPSGATGPVGPPGPSGSGGSGSGITYTASNTTPALANVGDLWYDTTADILFERQYDGTSNNWIDIGSPSLLYTTNAQTTGTTTSDALSPFLLMGA